MEGAYCSPWPHSGPATIVSTIMINGVCLTSSSPPLSLPVYLHACQASRARGGGDLLGDRQGVKPDTHGVSKLYPIKRSLKGTYIVRIPSAAGGEMHYVMRKILFLLMKAIHLERELQGKIQRRIS